MTDADSVLLAERDIVLVRADNPGPLTLTGTNSWLVGRDPCWVVDPGPAIGAHRDELLAASRSRGGIGGIAITPLADQDWKPSTTMPRSPRT